MLLLSRMLKLLIIDGLLESQASDAGDTAELDPETNDPFEASAFSQALENIASLSATNGGQASRLQYAQESVATQISNMEAALDGFSMWILPRKPPTWRSSKFWCKHRHRWWHKPILPIKSHWIRQ